jgi:hypothetical protein
MPPLFAEPKKQRKSCSMMSSSCSLPALIPEKTKMTKNQEFSTHSRESVITSVRRRGESSSLKNNHQSQLSAYFSEHGRLIRPSEFSATLLLTCNKYSKVTAVDKASAAGADKVMMINASSSVEAQINQEIKLRKTLAVIYRDKAR